MPQSMPGNITKGFILEELDRYLSTTAIANLASLKAELEDEGNLLPSIAKARLSLRNIDEQHLQDHWFDLGQPATKPDLWWKDIQPVDPIVRYGLARLLQAIIDRNTAGEPRLPVDSYWMCAGHHFEVVFTIGLNAAQTDPNHYSLFFMTPGPPISRRHLTDPFYKFGGRERIYVTRNSGRDLGEVDDTGPSGSGNLRKTLIHTVRPYKVVAGP